jgi:enamine deaminase RidA (YjgF/YER057c/UK114 family)
MAAEIRIFNPDTMGKPLGQYSQIARVKGASELVFIAGQIATDKARNLIGADDFEAQCAQVYANIETALKAVGGGWGNVVQFTTYLVHSQDVPKLRAFREREFPKFFPNGVYPPNTLIIIDRLVNESYLVEVQTVAAL